MTNDRQIERLLDSWFADGPMTAPDRVIDDVATRITRQPQRPAWRLQPWRFPTMSTPIRVVVIGVVLAAALAAGSLLLAGAPGPAPTPTPTPSPTASAQPTAAPTSSGAATMGRGQLEPGTYVTRPYAGDPISWQVTVPAGWTNGGGWYLYPTSLGGPDGKSAAGEPQGIAVAVIDDPQVVLDGCNFLGGTTDVSTVDELVAAIRAKADWIVSDPADVTVGGHRGKRLDIQLPDDLSRCGQGTYSVFAKRGTENGFYAQGPGQRLRTWILDVDGHTVLLQVTSFAATPAASVDEAQAVVESSVIAR